MGFPVAKETLRHLEDFCSNANGGFPASEAARSILKDILGESRESPVVTILIEANTGTREVVLEGALLPSFIKRAVDYPSLRRIFLGVSKIDTPILYDREAK